MENDGFSLEDYHCGVSFEAAREENEELRSRKSLRIDIGELSSEGAVTVVVPILVPFRLFTVKYRNLILLDHLPPRASFERARYAALTHTRRHAEQRGRGMHYLAVINLTTPPILSAKLFP